MATTELPADTRSLSTTNRELHREVSSLSLATLLSPLASLRLTVVLFFLSMVLVFAGTLAQIDHDIWYVINNYFRCWLAPIDVQVFFPRHLDIPGTFPFPGGKAIGLALSINLLAAHALRFKVTGRGTKLWLGWGLIAAGSLLTFVVVQSGLGNGIESELTASFTNGLWHALRAGLGGCTLLLAYILALSYQSQKSLQSFWLWILGAVSCVLLAMLTGWLFMNPDVRLDASGLRILWQLIKATAASLVLLAGCYCVFGRRGGIVLLHGGIALLMFSEFFTGWKAVEAQMWLDEGQKMNFAEDSRSVELAIVDKSGAHEDAEILIPETLVRYALSTGEKIDHPALPVSLRIVDYFPNSRLRLKQPTESTPATQGEGLLYVIEGESITTGVDENQTIENPAAYLEILKKDSDESIATVLLWANYSPGQVVEPMEIDGTPIEVSLRFTRVPKAYSIELVDFRHDKFVGTNEAKNFSSEVILKDPAHQVDRKVSLWMNNPLRYGGDTIYQASFDPRNSRRTMLQVVTNTGWMIPYVSCMLLATGMLAHFGATFLSFAQRKAAPSSYSQSSSLSQLWAQRYSVSVVIPLVVLLLSGAYTLSKLRPAKQPEAEMQIHEFGKLPVAYQGRVQPLDTLARNALTVLSDKETLELPEKKSGLMGLFGAHEKAPAIVWLLDLISDSPEAREHRCLRIDNLEVLQTLGLERRPGFRYSLEELYQREDEYIKQIGLADAVEEEQRSLTQARFMKLASNVTLLNALHDSFSSPLRHVSVDSREQAQQDVRQLFERVRNLDQFAPRAVPPAEGGQPWQVMLAAESKPLFAMLAGSPQREKLDPAAEQLRAILSAYAKKDVDAFNEGVADYQKLVAERAEIDASHNDQIVAASGPGSRKTAEKLSVARLQFESYFNHLRPFIVVLALYILAFLLACGAWMGATTTLNRSANWLLWFAFLVHTLALIGRIYISGRPPVTNLYSSAVFIGWAAVLFALIVEWIYRMGIGNLLAAMIGIPTLIVSHNLAGDGDTFKVLQAVLDTQFWLATHVICITVGYAATFVAGALGLLYVFMGQVADRLDLEQRKSIIRITYGTICFATFFSFVGTILGGLWADDSWGRFWGWDPKENGALIIVIWNALVLHARWGGMIQRRGLAVLAIFGNVVTTWSWFGVNAMGVGLHSYGFRAGMAFWLTVFVGSQLAIMLLGWIWPDKRSEETAALA